MTQLTQFKKAQVIEKYLDCRHIKVLIRSNTLMRYVTPNQIHRSFSNGKKIINSKSNREFYQENFLGGYYSFTNSGHIGVFEYRLLPSTSNFDFLIRETKERIQEIIWVDCDVSISPTALPVTNHLGELHKINLVGELYRSKVLTTLSNNEQAICQTVLEFV